MGRAAVYRQMLGDALVENGPAAPTLCEGWTTRDLAVHVILRDRRPDVIAGMFLPPLKGRSEAIRQEYAAKPYGDLVDLVRAGAPLSVTMIPGVDDLMNTVEFYVHTQDVLRAQPEWDPATAPDSTEEQEQDDMWSRLRLVGRLMLLKAPTGVVLAPSDGPGGMLRASMTARPPTKQGSVTVTGLPTELMLFAFGRKEAAQVDFRGDPSAVAALKSAKLGF